jgi:hypothetical protein
MYARVTLLEIDTTRIGVDAALRKYVDEILPVTRQQPGYEGIYMLATPDGKGLVMSLWATEDAAEASAGPGFYSDVLASFVTLFRSPPGRERYEVVFSDVAAPALA